MVTGVHVVEQGGDHRAFCHARTQHCVRLLRVRLATRVVAVEGGVGEVMRTEDEVDVIQVTLPLALRASQRSPSKRMSSALGL